MGKETQRELDGVMICFGNKLPRSCRWMGSGVGWREERKRVLEGIPRPLVLAPGGWQALLLPEVGRRADRKGRGGNPVWGMLGLRRLQIARRRLQRPWQSQAL